MRYKIEVVHTLKSSDEKIQGCPRNKSHVVTIEVARNSKGQEYLAKTVERIWVHGTDDVKPRDILEVIVTAYREKL
jgi:hypothetical protein